MSLLLTERSSQFSKTPHPTEDFGLCAADLPLGAVADGVTLEVEEGKPYPGHSGAFEVARFFCEAAAVEAKKRYASFGEADLLEVFRAGNAAASVYNRAQGRTKEALNYLDVDLFAATAAFGLIKNNTLFWFSLCDSFVFVLDAQGAVKFKSPEPWARMREPWLAMREIIEPKERRVFIRKNFRNPAEGARGYGVVTGEKTAERFLFHGALALQAGDTAGLCTDGFEPYLELPQFTVLLTQPNVKLMHAFTEQKSKEDERFGHERTLVLLPHV